MTRLDQLQSLCISKYSTLKNKLCHVIPLLQRWSIEDKQMSTQYSMTTFVTYDVWYALIDVLCKWASDDMCIRNLSNVGISISFSKYKLRIGMKMNTVKDVPLNKLNIEHWKQTMESKLISSAQTKRQWLLQKKVTTEDNTNSCIVSTPFNDYMYESWRHDSDINQWQDENFEYTTFLFTFEKYFFRT